MRFLFLFFCVAFNWFNKVSGVFYRFFGSKWVENDFLSKKKKTLFFWSLQWPNSKDERTCHLLI